MPAESLTTVAVNGAQIVYRRVVKSRPLLVLMGSARRVQTGILLSLLFLLFPKDVAESFYREFGDIVAAARAQLSVDLLNRQAAAMDAWHRNSVSSQLRQLCVPALIATGMEDIVIPASNALKLVNRIPGAWLAQFPHGGHGFMAQYPRALADFINCFLATHHRC